MADLQTALSKAIQSWETPVSHTSNTTMTTITTTPSGHVMVPQPNGKKYFVTTTNVSRRTFNYVRDNPGCATREVVKALQAEGLNPTSVTSLVSQMARQGFLRRDEDGRYHAVSKEYVPIKTSVRKKLTKAQEAKEKKPMVVITRKAQTSDVTEVMRERVAQGKAAPVQEFSAEVFVDRLTLREARQVYVYLRNFFATGGA